MPHSNFSHICLINSPPASASFTCCIRFCSCTLACLRLRAPLCACARVRPSVCVYVRMESDVSLCNGACGTHLSLLVLRPMVCVKLPCSDADEATPPDRTLAFYFDKIHLHAEGKNSKKNCSHNPLNSISFQASVMRGGLYCDDAQFAVTVDPVAKAWQRDGGGLSQTGPAASVKSPRGDKKRGKREKPRDGSADAQGSSADYFSSPVLVLGPDTYSLAEIKHVDVSGKLVVETASAPTWRAETSGVGKAKGTAPNGFRPPGPAEGWHHHPLCNSRSVRVRQVELHCDTKLVQVTFHRCYLPSQCMCLCLGLH
jgi:hypothetical protein